MPNLRLNRYISWVRFLPVSAPTLILLTLIALWAGCQSPQQPAPAITDLSDSPRLARDPARISSTEVRENEPEIPARDALRPQPQPTPPATNRAPAETLTRSPLDTKPRRAKTPLRLEWISLAQWCQEHRLAEPRKLPGENFVQEIKSSSGLVTLTLGSHIATWNGVQFWLGFAPRLQRGVLHLHSLDLEKHLRPLLLPDPDLTPIQRTVVLDPGHGGDNLGTRSILRAAYEKDYALDWARRLAPLLAAQGWQVFLTRTNDRALSITERVEFTSEKQAVLFISLHFNSIPGHPNQRGLETYALAPQWMPSHHSRDGGEPIAFALPGNAHDEKNFLSAMKIHASLLKATKAPDRGVRRARFMGVLRNQSQPAVLIEGGYLTSPSESRNIDHPDYRQKLAEAVAAALD